MIACEFSFCELSALPPNLRPAFLGDDHWARLGTPPPHPGQPLFSSPLCRLTTHAHQAGAAPSLSPGVPRITRSSEWWSPGAAMWGLGNHLPSVPQFPPLWEEGLAVNGLESGDEDTTRLASQGREED